MTEEKLPNTSWIREGDHEQEAWAQRYLGKQMFAYTFSFKPGSRSLLTQLKYNPALSDLRRRMENAWRVKECRARKNSLIKFTTIEIQKSTKQKLEVEARRSRQKLHIVVERLITDFKGYLKELRKEYQEKTDVKHQNQRNLVNTFNKRKWNPVHVVVKDIQKKMETYKPNDSSQQEIRIPLDLWEELKGKVNEAYDLTKQHSNYLK